MYFSEMKAKLYFISFIILFNYQQGFSQIKIDNYHPDIDYLGLSRMDYDEAVISAFEFNLLEKISEVRLKFKHAAHWKNILSGDRLGYLKEKSSNKKLESFLENIISRTGLQSNYHFNTTEKATSGNGLVSTILDNHNYLNINQNAKSSTGNITLNPEKMELNQLHNIEDIPFIKKNYLFGIEFKVIKELKKRDNIVNIAYLCWGGIFYTRLWVNTTYKLIGLTIIVKSPFSHFKAIKKYKPRNYQSLN